MRWLLCLLLAAPLRAQTPVVIGQDTVLISLRKAAAKPETVTVVRVDTVPRSLPSVVMPSVRVGQWGPMPDSLLGTYNGLLLTGWKGIRRWPR
jgi:hypothetical protein